MLVDKPAEWTSHDVVAKMRGMLGTKKVGHAGTLDPMATGLLVIASGKATKLLTYITGHGKTYTATIRLGQSTVTDDAEGEVTAEADANGVTDGAIAAAVQDLSGDIMQVPSAVSAIKINGQRSYARVRAGEDVEIPARPVTVSRFDVTAIRRGGAFVDIDAEVAVSAGTYIRALARDLGEALGVGGHLTALRRTRVGDFRVEDALTMEQLQAKADAGERLIVHALAEAAAGALESVPVDGDGREELSHGRRAPAGGATLGSGAHAAALADDGATLVAIVRQEGAWLRPVIVFEGAAV